MIRLLCAVGLLTLAACAGESPSTHTPATQTLLASPAALNCTAHHGRIIIRQTGSGSKGFCTLPDGRTLDLWEYFHQTNP